MDCCPMDCGGTRGGGARRTGSIRLRLAGLPCQRSFGHGPPIPMRPFFPVPSCPRVVMCRARVDFQLFKDARRRPTERAMGSRDRAVPHPGAARGATQAPECDRSIHSSLLASKEALEVSRMEYGSGHPGQGATCSVHRGGPPRLVLWCGVGSGEQPRCVRACDLSCWVLGGEDGHTEGQAAGGR
jgi:hypothetical protein